MKQAARSSKRQVEIVGAPGHGLTWQMRKAETLI
jgi:hypothetical protein